MTFGWIEVPMVALTILGGSGSSYERMRQHCNSRTGTNAHESGDSVDANFFSGVYQGSMPMNPGHVLQGEMLPGTLDISRFSNLS